MTICSKHYHNYFRYFDNEYPITANRNTALAINILSLEFGPSTSASISLRRFLRFRFPPSICFSKISASRRLCSSTSTALTSVTFALLFSSSICRSHSSSQDTGLCPELTLKQRKSSFLRLQAHVTLTFFLHCEMGEQVPEWQSSRQRWPHSISLGHTS